MIIFWQKYINRTTPEGIIITINVTITITITITIIITINITIILEIQGDIKKVKTIIYLDTQMEE